MNAILRVAHRNLLPEYALFSLAMLLWLVSLAPFINALSTNPVGAIGSFLLYSFVVLGLGMIPLAIILKAKKSLILTITSDRITLEDKKGVPKSYQRNDIEHIEAMGQLELPMGSSWVPNMGYNQGVKSIAITDRQGNKLTFETHWRRVDPSKLVDAFNNNGYKDIVTYNF